MTDAPLNRLSIKIYQVQQGLGGMLYKKISIKINTWCDALANSFHCFENN